MDFSPLGKAVAIILTVVLIFLFPLPYVAKTVSETVEDLVNTYATEFSDTARQQRTITKEMYEKMIRELDKTGELYDVDFEVSHPISGNELAKIELGDKIPEESTVQTFYSKKETLAGEISGKEPSEGNNTLDEIQSFSVHTHTNDCYAGHMHTPVYGTSNLTNVPIFIYRAPNAYNSTFRCYMMNYSVGCSACGQTLFEFGSLVQYPGGVGYAKYYSKDSNGNISSNTVNISATDYYNSDLSDFNSLLGTLLTTNYKSGNSSSDHVYTRDFNWSSSGYSGLPVFDSLGNITSYSPISCVNIFGHPNTSACYPIGKMTELEYKVYRAFDSSGNYTILSIQADCTECGRSVLGISNYYNGAYNMSWRRSGIQTVFYDYDKNGNIVYRNYNTVYNNMSPYGGTTFAHENQWDNISRSIFSTLEPKAFALPNKINYHYHDSSSWNFWTTPITPRIMSIPVRQRGGLMATIFWEPYRGCVYCGTYGANYSCRQVEDETYDCSHVVTSIAATNPTQTIDKGGSITTTATATYLDGHTGTVNCEVSGFNTNQIGNQTVSLIYSGLVGNAKTTGTRTCTVKVTVKEAYKLTGITVSPDSQEVPRYQNPNFVVTASYDNGTSKQVSGYTMSVYNSSLLETQPITITYEENDITKTATINIIVKNLTTTCPVCNAVYFMDDNDTDQGCPNCNSTITAISASPDNIVLHQGEPLDIIVEAVYANGKRSVITDWTSNYDLTQVGIQDVTITYQTFTVVISVDVRYELKTCSICSFEYELNNDGTDPGCPVCGKTVVSLEANPEELTINKHQSLPITVTATYKDGHTEIINDWASNLLADTAGIYEVMILYQNTIDLIRVTVLEDGQIECPICGLKYIFNDSPKGCPSCYVTLTGIEASLRNGGTKVPYRSKLNLQITKIFKDEHRELTYTGWTVSDYNPNQLGNQTIKVNYGGFQDQLDIEVEDVLPEVTCPNGHTYYLNEDGSDSGCPYCNSPEGREEALFYFDTTYTNFILDEIYSHGEYRLEKGDYLKVTIKPRKVSILSKLLSLFNSLEKKEYTFGGEVS